MYLPEVEELKEFLIKNGNQKFIERWCVPFQKRDAIIGPEGSIDFIKQFIKQEEVEVMPDVKNASSKFNVSSGSIPNSNYSNEYSIM